MTNKCASSLSASIMLGKLPFFVTEIKFTNRMLVPIDRLHLDEIVPTVPSKSKQTLNLRKSSDSDKTNLNSILTIAVGFNVETVTYKNLKFQVWDLGGQTGLRPYWRCYYQDTNAVIYVVDSADKERIEIAKQELEMMLQEEELKGVPVLVLANK